MGQVTKVLKGASLVTWARFLSLARSKLRLCSANHRPGYWSNLPCDWPSTAWTYSKQEAENRPWCCDQMIAKAGNETDPPSWLEPYWLCLAEQVKPAHLPCTKQSIQRSLYNEIREILLKTHKFHHLPGTVFTKSCLFFLPGKTTYLERPQSSAFALYRLHCINITVPKSYVCLLLMLSFFSSYYCALSKIWRHSVNFSECMG